MELLVELANKKHMIDNVDGIILPLENYSVESILSYSISEIKEIVKKVPYKVFIKLNRNLWNEDIPNIKKIMSDYPISSLEASGVSVGLPKGVNGNCEVGHMTIGAGRYIKQPLTLINEKINT